MRITNNLLIHNMIWNMNNNLESMNEKQNQLSTGKKVRRPSDDPVGTTRIIKIKSDIAENVQFKENARDAKSWINISETSLMDTKSILQRIRELAVQGANDTYTEKETDKIAKEIDQLLEELIVNANSTMAGRYIFSGFNTDKKLMNEDGTYNLDITSEKLTQFKSIAYEVAVGEGLNVGVNYLDVYGAVKKDTTMRETFSFGGPSSGDSKVGEVKGKASKHKRIQGPVDYKKDLTGETLTIKVGDKTYSVDTSKLTGNITQDEYLNILKSATQTAPPASIPLPTLSESAEVFFVKSKDPNNKTGELVIEAKAFGNLEMAVGGSAKAFDENPKTTDGKGLVSGSVASLKGMFDYRKDYSIPARQLSFKVGGTNYYVLSTQLDGKVANDTEFLNIIKSAKSPEGVSLSSVADITFNSIGGLNKVGQLSIVAKNKHNETITFVDEGGGFSNPSITEGITPVHATLSGAFDKTVDLSSSSLSFTYDGKTYNVDTSTLDGTADKAAIEAAIGGAKDASGNLLSSVAGITFDDVAGTLTVRANTAEDYKRFNYMDTGSGFTATPTSTTGVTPKTPDFEGAFDVSKVADQLLTFKYKGVTYNVDTSTSPTPLTTANFADRIKNASAVFPASGILDDVATINFTVDSGNVGHLSVVADTPFSSKFEINKDGVIRTSVETTVGKAPVKASMTGPFDKTKDLSSSSLTFTYGGKTYTVNTATLDGTADEAAIEAAINGATDGSGGTLGAVADVDFDDVAGTLTLTAKTVDGGEAFTHTDPAGGFTSAPTKTTGVDPIIGDFKSKIDIKAITDQPLRVTYGGVIYNVDTSSSPTPLTMSNFSDRLKNATALAPGSGKLDDVATISFSVDSGTIGDLKLTGDTALDGTFKISTNGLLDTSTSVKGMAFSAATKASLEYIVNTKTDFKTTGKTLTFSMGGKTYTVPTATLDGKMTHSEFIDAIKNADDGSGGKLSDVADIGLTLHEGNGDIGTLKIESKSPSADSISVGGTGDMSVKYPEVTGPQTALIQGEFDFSKDLTASDLHFKVDGKIYKVDTTSFDGTITEADFLNAIKNAATDDGELLSSVMDVNFTLSSGRIGQLTLEKATDAKVDVIDTGGGFTGAIEKRDGSVVDNDVVLTSSKPITDAMVADSEKGTGIQSFVVTHNDITKRIDINMTGITTVADMTTAVNAKLKDAFGLNNDTPPTNNVSMSIYNDGSNDFVRFTGHGEQDGSKAFLKVDVIMSDKPQMIQDIEDFSKALTNKDNDGIQKFLKDIDVHLDNVIKNLADLGAKDNRLDFIEKRIDSNNLSMTEMLSKVQDIDYSKVTLEFKSLESIYRASLSVGAKVIQPTLVDFIK